MQPHHISVGIEKQVKTATNRKESAIPQTNLFIAVS